MAVTQVAFEILPAIQEGIDKGIFFRFGGVIRDQAGTCRDKRFVNAREMAGSWKLEVCK